MLAVVVSCQSLAVGKRRRKRKTHDEAVRPAGASIAGGFAKRSEFGLVDARLPRDALDRSSRDH